MASKAKKSKTIFGAIRNEFANPNYGSRQLKRDLRKLQKQGLFSAKIDLKEYSPTRYATNVVRRFADVLNGKAKVIQVPAAEKKYYKEAGHRVKGKAVVIETPNGERVRRLKPTKEGIPQVRTYQRGINGKRVGTRTMVPYERVEAHLRQMIARAPKPKGNAKYAFRFYGNNSLSTFADAQLMLDYFMRYNAVETIMRTDDSEQEHELYKNFEVISLTLDQHVSEDYAQRQRNRANQNERNKQRRQQWWKEKWASMDEFEKESYRRSRREYNKDRNVSRETMDPTKLEALRIRNARNQANRRAAKKAK